MAGYTGNIIGIGGEGRHSKGNDGPDALNAQRSFREVLKPDLFDKYVMKTAQAQGIICHIYIPKSITVAASDTVTLTVKAA